MTEKLRSVIAGDLPGANRMFFWNMSGSGIYALTSVLLIYLTIRIVGADKGGIFAIALTLAQMFVYIAYFEMRNFEVTDAKNKYSFAQYHGVKIINCVLMLFVVLCFCLFKSYELEKFIIILLVGVYRMLDGYADVYEAEFHKQGRLDLAGKSMTFRTVLSVSAYFLCLAWTGDLILSLMFAIAFGVMGILIFDCWIFQTIGTIEVIWSGKVFWQMVTDCFPLFLGMFLWTYLLSASRIAVDNVLSSKFQSHYQVIFLPISMINLLTGFLVRPSLLDLTENYAAGFMKKFWNAIIKMALILIFFTGICMAGAFFIGIPVLSAIVNLDLGKYRNILVFLIFAGGINGVAGLFYYVLSIFRNRRDIVIGYGVAAVVAWFVSEPMVRQWRMWGAAASYAVSTSVLFIIFFFGILRRPTIR